MVSPDGALEDVKEGEGKPTEEEKRDQTNEQLQRIVVIWKMKRKIEFEV